MANTSPDHLKALVEAALWEIADESTHAPEHTALDSTIDAVRANVMSGMMPEEAQVLFQVSDGGLSRSGSAPVAAPPAFHPPFMQPPPIPTQSPSSVLDATPPDDHDDALARTVDALTVREDDQAGVVDSDGEEWDEWPSETPPVVVEPTRAERAAAAAAERLAQERARVQRSGNLRNRAAEKAAEAAAEAVLANLPSRPI